MIHPITNKNGFTLIELSIVLVIIGLIVGGIVVGKEMIRNSEVKSLIKVSTSFAQKLNTFKLKYNSLPGEFPTYVNFFPTLTGPYCPKTSNMGLTNMNGLLDTGYETEAAFAHLHAAGLIEMGRPQILQDGTVQNHYDCFYNNMQQNAGFSTKIGGLYDTIATDTVFGNGINFGYTSLPAITLPEAIAMDTKIDDGLATTGRMRGFSPLSNQCVGYDNLHYFSTV